MRHILFGIFVVLLGGVGCSDEELDTIELVDNLLPLWSGLCLLHDPHILADPCDHGSLGPCGCDSLSIFRGDAEKAKRHLVVVELL